MSDLFTHPVQIEVLPAGEDGVEYTVTHRGVVTKRHAPARSARAAVVDEITQASRRTGLTVGAVVFNAVLPDVAECGFLVTDGESLWDATDQEFSEDQERHWKEQHRGWRRRHKLPRRAAQHAGERADLEVVGAPSRPRQVTIPEFVVDSPHEVSEPVARVRVRVPEPPRPREAPAAGGSVAGMDSLMDRGKHVQHALEGWRGGLNMLGFRLPPGKDEDMRRWLVRSIQLGWPGVGYATVVNEKGSTGKTPTALMLAGALQAHAKGMVVVRDGNPSGNAHERAEYTPPEGADEYGEHLNDGDLARAYLTRGQIDSTALWQYLHLHTTDHYALLSHHVQHSEYDHLTDEESDASYQALAPHARAVITDTGNVPWERRDVPVLHRTSQLVVPMLTYSDRENGARKTLGDTLERRGGRYLDMVRNAVVVIHAAEPGRKHAARAQEYVERWKSSGAVREVIPVPYDEHMASHDLRFGDLHDATRTAMLRVAAAVAEGFRAA